MQQGKSDTPRIIFFGMECSFSLPVLSTLLRSGAQVCAVVIPAGNNLAGTILDAVDDEDIMLLSAPRMPGGLLPMAATGGPSSIVQLAWRHHIPVWRVRKLAAQSTLATLASYQPDLICVACFNALLSSTILHLPRLGCLNVHPSLLPALRGPMPLFWTLRLGHKLTGTTVHYMTSKLDCGAILAQEAIIVPHGIRSAELEERCAQLGGELLARVVFDVYHGRAKPREQDEAQSSYRSYPRAEDYVVNVWEWGARHLYNFICGVASEESPVTVSIDRTDSTQRLTLYAATAYGTAPLSAQEKQQVGNEFIVHCHDGWVRVITINRYPGRGSG
jgi:methionyl-tRNA formyltransferase